MRGISFLIVIIMLLTFPVSAMDLTAPTVPESAQSHMPSNPENLGQGILEVLKDCIAYFHPDLKEAGKSCLSVIAVCILISVLQAAPEISRVAASLTGATAISLILLRSTNSLISLGLQTISEISEYGKLFLPVMTAALAAQGGITASTQLYAGTAVFNTILSSVISAVLRPAIFLFLAMSISYSAIQEKILSSFRDQIKKCAIWILKAILYIFTGYISITGVISGATDAMALKAAKITISGVVPVVGGILSDASEAVLVSAGALKNSAGLYGFFAILAIWLRPFLKIGTHYLMLKITGGLCTVLEDNVLSALVRSFSEAMGLILAMTGTMCLMLIISIVCFMRGVG